MLVVWFFVYKKLAQFAVGCALPPRRSESPGCAADNKPSCVLHLLGSFIGSRGFSSLEQGLNSGSYRKSDNLICQVGQFLDYWRKKLVFFWYRKQLRSTKDLWVKGHKIKCSGRFYSNKQRELERNLREVGRKHKIMRAIL